MREKNSAQNSSAKKMGSPKNLRKKKCKKKNP